MTRIDPDSRQDAKAHPGRTWQVLRRGSQGLFLAVFVVLLFLTEGAGRNTISWPVRVFLDFDPLSGIASYLAARTLPEKFYLAALTLASAVLVGRVFCGWVCPLGTLNHIVNRRRERPLLPVARNGAPGRAGEGRPDWRRAKYVVLAGLLAAAAFSLNLTGLLDPISLLVRSGAAGFIPAWNQAVAAGFDRLAETPVSGLSEAVFRMLKTCHVAAVQPPYSGQADVLAIVLAGVLLLNLVRKRFFCRYVCPLGALLGTAATRCLTRLEVDATACTSCMVCTRVCPARAEPFPPGHWKRSECFVCYACVAACPESCIRIGFETAPLRAPTEARVDIGRRRILAAAAAGVVAVPVTRSLPGAGRPRPDVVRPPGSRAERDFLAACARCGECMKVCVANGLHPAAFQAGIEGLWTPVFDMRQGYCEYNCTLCGQVCPTQAIRELDVSVKKRARIGLAFIDPGRCLPYAFGVPCIVCEEHCPTPVKAIWFEEGDVAGRDGARRAVKLPRVDPRLCIGCGICEYKCPVTDQAAIRVTSVNESRSGDGGLFLPEAAPDIF